LTGAKTALPKRRSQAAKGFKFFVKLFDEEEDENRCIAISPALPKTVPTPAGAGLQFVVELAAGGANAV
jgi:hypothetical protein